jgi:hypothetical protein
VFVTGCGLAVRFVLSGIKLLGRTACSNVDLLTVMDDDFRMVAIGGDVSYEGDEFALEVVQVADRLAVALGDCGVKRAVTLGRTEEDVRVAILQGGDSEDLSGHTSGFAGQFRGARGGEAFNPDVGHRLGSGTRGLRRFGGVRGLLRDGRNGEHQSDAEESRQDHLVGSILSELLKRLK